jgi:hypothetical protein
MRNLILLNGPPRCGKDTAGALLAERIESDGSVVWTEKVSRILKERTHALYGQVDRAGAPLPHDYFEQRKDAPLPEFLGRTPRQAYIAVSEKYLKPLHGEDVLGRMLADDIAKTLNDPAYPKPRAVIVTDSGFRAEVEPLAAMAERVLLVHIHREGFTFEGDSRDYWNWRAPHGPERNTIEVVNPGTREGYARVLETVVGWARA